MRKLFVALVAVAATSIITFAQEDAKVHRSLSFYVDSASGELHQQPELGDSQRLFAGNEFEIGAVYNQNFAKTPWLNLWVKALVVTGAFPKYNASGEWIGNESFSIHGYGMPRAQIGLNFGGHGILALDTRGLLANELYYTLNFGRAGSLTFQSIVEMWLVPMSGTSVVGLYNVLDLFELRLNYQVAIADGWTYRTKLGFRFYDETSAKKFGESFHIQWENQIVWQVTSSFYTWTQLRYRARDIAKGTGTAHDVMLQAGLGYTFDFSDK